MFGDVVLAVDYRGGGRVRALINAYSLSRREHLWRQEVEVQRKDEAEGQLALPDYKRNLLYLGNGPLSVLDVTTGQVRWTHPCNEVGSPDLGTAQLMPDGGLLIGSTKDCGEDQDKRVLLLDDATGAIRWSVTARAHEYKTGDVKHQDFQWLVMNGDDGAPSLVVIAGERLQAVRYADGTPAWQVRDKVGRFITYLGGGIAFIDNDELTVYGLTTGTPAWTLDVKDPFARVMPIPDEQDVVLVTYHRAWRLDPASGTVRWTIRREDESWTRLVLPPLFLITTGSREWGAYDLATGAKRWEWRREWGDGMEIDTTIDVRVHQTVLIYEGKEWLQYLRRPAAPFRVWALDAASGAVRWQLREVAGERIQGVELLTNDILAVLSEKTGIWHVVTIADGSVTAVGAATARRSGAGYRVSYRDRGNTLMCVGPDGATVWTRRGVPSQRTSDESHLEAAQGYVVWAARDGTVEIIRVTDGTSLYSTTADRDPTPVTTADGRHVLIPVGQTLKILSLEP